MGLLAAARMRVSGNPEHFMLTHSLQGRGLGSRASGGGGQQFISSTTAVGWLHILRFWIGRSRQRRQLAELAEFDDHLLKDIGISQDEALREAAKPFWR
jgi:uncharacterized protein YjiS (DUF1127 family)